jgi:Na+-translocating ferredoxin:NAD+ oxidoreductase RnfE subunit
MRHIVARNPVWMVPLGLPFVLYGGQSWTLAALFAGAVLLVVPLAHALSFFIERQLPHHARLLPVLLAAATCITVLQLILSASGIVLSDRQDLMVEALTVSGLVVWPTIAAPTDETFSQRMAVAVGIAVGFVAGFVPLATVRLLAAAGGYQLAVSAFGGFVLLAVGRMVISGLRRRRREPEYERSVEL